MKKTAAKILAYIADNQCTTHCALIAQGTGLKQATVERHVQNLMAAGLVTLETESGAELPFITRAEHYSLRLSDTERERRAGQAMVDRHLAAVARGQ